MLREEAGPSFYLPIAQARAPAGAFHVGTAAPPASLLDTLRRTLGQVDAAVPVTRARTLREQADLNVTDERLAMTIALALAAAAVLLAAVGLYATIAHSVAQRTREIGVRLALGAVPRDVRRLVLASGTRDGAGRQRGRRRAWAAVCEDDSRSALRRESGRRRQRRRRHQSAGWGGRARELAASPARRTGQPGRRAPRRVTRRCRHFLVRFAGSKFF